MKLRSIHNWNYKPELEGLLFFAQTLDELLFDYTLDTYKPPCLNSCYLCIEALSLIDEIEKNTIDRANLKHVLEELSWSLGKDEAAKSLIDYEINEYVFLSEDENLSKVKVKLELLINAINPSRYLNKCFGLIYDAVKNNKKKIITTLSRSIVTTLLNLGYSQKYLYNFSQDFFFYQPKEKIDSVEYIKEYFSSFLGEEKEYEVTFIVSNLTSEISKSCKVFNLEVLETIPEIENIEIKDKFTKSEQELYIKNESVRAFDPYSARESVERSIEKIKNLFVLFHHKLGITWKPQVLAYCKSNGSTHLLQKPVGPMQKGFDLKPEQAAKELNRFINNFALSQGSFKKFDRIVDFHGIAISGDTVENQLINLWTSIETVVPSHPGKNKITNIINSTVPFLMNDYIEILLKRLTSDLLNWNKKETFKILNKVEDPRGLTHTQKLCLLLTLEENKTLRDDLYTKIGNFVLLRNRIFNLSETIKSTKNISDFHHNHKIKIEWQIRRIYRTRNLIVHSGKTPPYTSMLVENAHTYLDRLLVAIRKYSIDLQRIGSIEQAFEFARLKYEKNQRAIKNETAINKENFLSILFP